MIIPDARATRNAADAVRGQVLWSYATPRAAERTAGRFFCRFFFYDFSLFPFFLFLTRLTPPPFPGTVVLFCPVRYSYFSPFQLSPNVHSPPILIVYTRGNNIRTGTCLEMIYYFIFLTEFIIKKKTCLSN